jgi:hypothetical protein
MDVLHGLFSITSDERELSHYVLHSVNNDAPVRDIELMVIKSMKLDQRKYKNVNAFYKIQLSTEGKEYAYLLDKLFEEGFI